MDGFSNNEGNVEDTDSEDEDAKTACFVVFI